MRNLLLDKPIARGRTADVYEWDEGHVIKLFHNWFELRNIEYELRITRAVNASGVQSPAVGELIQVDGRNGLIYERVAGKSMLEMFLHMPWKVFVYAPILAQLHIQMHECVFDADAPAQRGRLQNKIGDAETLPVSLKGKLLKVLDGLPNGDRVCHGDFHPANVLMSGRNASVVDWFDASRGNPLADVARTSVILLGAAETTQIPNQFSKMFIKIFHAVYLQEYFCLRPGGEDEYRRWLPIVAGARLSENITELDEWLVKQAEG